MTNLHVSMLRSERARKAIELGALMFIMGVASAFAQEAAPADPAAAPAAGDAAKTADPSKGNFWVKLCDKVKYADPAAKDPKTAAPLEKKVCVTQHESFDGNTGGLLVSSAVRDVEGDEKKGFVITVPLGMVIPAGLHVFVDDEKDVKKSIALGFDTCLPSGCTAETVLTPEQLDQVTKAKLLTVVAISLQGVQVPFKLPMGGFATTYAGEPTDTTKFLNNRKIRLMALRERLIAKQQATQAATAEAVKGMQEDAAAAGTVPADATAAPANAAAAAAPAAPVAPATPAKAKPKK